PTWAKITQTVHGKGQRAGPRGTKSPKQSTGRASVLSPRTNVLICVLRDSHGPTDVLCVLTDTHGRPVCADGHPQTSCPQTSCVCWRTPTDALCVLNRQPTWAKITQTVHGKGQRAESKDQHQRADMCTDGQPRTSCVPRGPKSPEQSMGRVSVLSPRTNVLICVLTDTHICPVCADGHTRTHTESHGHPVCADGQPRTQPTSAKITQTVHGKGQHADMCTDGQPRTSCVCLRTRMDTHGHTRTATYVLCVLTDTHVRPVCADGHPQTSYSPRAPKSPKQSTGRVSVLSPRTNVLICVLMDSHGRPVCADGHTRTHTNSHGRPVCAGGHPRTSPYVLCVLNRQPTWDKITQTVHGKGQRVESKDQRSDMCTEGQPQTSRVC
ncbi:unnamed protein product, partial [Brassica rapa]